MPQPLTALAFNQPREKLAASFRALKARGVHKSQLVALISHGARSRETRRGLLRLLDEIWKEEPVTERIGHGPP